MDIILSQIIQVDPEYDHWNPEDRERLDTHIWGNVSIRQNEA